MHRSLKLHAMYILYICSIYSVLLVIIGLLIILQYFKEPKASREKSDGGH